MKHLASTLLCAFLASSAYAAGNHGSHSSLYAGEEKRDIKSLSPADIAEMTRGGGWGLAKAAELNGVPGPMHLLELKDEIPLSPDQVQKIETLYDEMKASAVELGKELIRLERELELQFQNRTVTNASLKESLSAISDTRETLRYTHLATHLETPQILSPAQIERYNFLRGYSNGGPCANPPKGHDLEKWRRHNNC